MLIRRGGCKFTKKIIAAQKLNNDLAIIYDNSTTATPNVIMVNDGHGHLVDIPSVFISGLDGDNLVNTVNECNGSVVLMIKFETFKKKMADTTLWLDINHVFLG